MKIEDAFTIPLKTISEYLITNKSQLLVELLKKDGITNKSQVIKKLTPYINELLYLNSVTITQSFNQEKTIQDVNLEVENINNCLKEVLNNFLS